MAPSFSGYAWAAQTVGAEVCSIPLREENNFAMDMAQMESGRLDGAQRLRGLLFQEIADKLRRRAVIASARAEGRLFDLPLPVCRYS